MADQNIWVELDGESPKAYLSHLQSKLSMVVLQHHRSKEWSKKKLRKRLGATKVQTKALLRGYLDKFSTDLLVTWVVKLGYSFDIVFDKNSSEPLTITVACRTKA